MRRPDVRGVAASAVGFTLFLVVVMWFGFRPDPEVEVAAWLTFAGVTVLSTLIWTGLLSMKQRPGTSARREGEKGMVAAVTAKGFLLLTAYLVVGGNMKLFGFAVLGLMNGLFPAMAIKTAQKAIREERRFGWRRRRSIGG
jgi:hypothetical protein